MSDSIAIVDKYTTKMYVSSEQLCYNLTDGFAAGYLSMIDKGLYELQDREMIALEDAGKYGLIFDVEKLYLDTKKQYFVMIEERR